MPASDAIDSPVGVVAHATDPDFDATAADLAAVLDADRVGPNVAVSGVAPLDAATATDLAFSTYDDPEPIADSGAGVVVVPTDVSIPAGRAALRSPDPKRDFVRVLREYVGDGATPGVHPTAVVSDDAELGADCVVGPNAHVGPGVVLGDRVVVGAGCALGGPGFGFVRTRDDELLRQPHVGTVRVGDDAELGANCTVDRAPFGETVVERGAKLSARVHVAHGARIGADATVAFGAGVAGGSTVGARTTVHPHVAVATDVTVGDDAELGMGADVLDDVPSGARVVGSPARRVDGAER
ncbi:LpxD N-terminal domain-containing protein [Halobacterium litoreum]|uniref:LpxD N-terminal domain-containing protein n=1 Tax=Halobacterium litoreum TaxID=2039234 RepID=A0ABD5NCB6_9EURY|nr:LpxD N-terminal domain-containing protein [Halobacterium litoreum]